MEVGFLLLQERQWEIPRNGSDDFSPLAVEVISGTTAFRRDHAWPDRVFRGADFAE